MSALACPVLDTMSFPQVLSGNPDAVPAEAGIHYLFPGFPDQETVSQYEKDLFCHSEFISESHNFSMLQTPEILKRVQDDNCDTASKLGNDRPTTNMTLLSQLSIVVKWKIHVKHFALIFYAGFFDFLFT